MDTKVYQNIFNHLNKVGYERGDTVTYFEMIETCENLDMDIDSIDLDTFEETYEITIG